EDDEHDGFVEGIGELLHDAAGGGDERLARGGRAAEQVQTQAGVEVARVFVLPQVAAVDEGHGDVVNRGDVEPELLGEGAGAEALGGAHDGLQQGDAFVEGENGGHDGWGSCLFKINNFP